MTRRRTFLSGLTALGLGACARNENSESPVRVFAAASLTDVFTQTGAAFATSGRIEPVFNFASSATLARQIEDGARADIFVSADVVWMDYLAERALIEPEGRVTLLSNTLVLIAPADQPITLAIAPGFGLRNALAGGRLAMADPESVPAGRYGAAALTSLGVWDDVEPLVARAEDVRAALRFVEAGEAAAGIVYRTDALAAGDRVQIIGTFPTSAHPPIVYPAAILRGRLNADSRDFMTFLRGARARAIFERAGFITASDN